MNWLNLIKTLAPVILTAINPKIGQLAPLVTVGIQEAEAIKGASGADKLAHAINIVNTGVTGLNQQIGHDVVNVGGLDSAIAAGISAVVDVANLLHPTVAANAGS